MDALISCDDSKPGEFCACGFSAATAECCISKEECVTSWFVDKCKKYCKNKEWCIV